MIITQENIIEQITEEENINTATVRRVIKSMEKVVFDYLSYTSSTENTVIKLMDGLSPECRYIPEKEVHSFEDINSTSRIWVRPKITRYYNRKLNAYFQE